jgi:hypothetical protein
MKFSEEEIGKGLEPILQLLKNGDISVEHARKHLATHVIALMKLNENRTSEEK